MKKMIVFSAFFLLFGVGCSTSSLISRETSRFGQVVSAETLGVDTAPVPTPGVGTGGAGGKGGWVRLADETFAWGNIEKESRGVYDWTTTDREVQKWQALDQEILVVLWPFAQWDQESCHGKLEQQKMKSICFVEGYENWIRAVVDRYDFDGENDMPGLLHAVSHFEIGLEPNFQIFPLAYGEVFRLAHDVIKKENPTTVVLWGAIANLSDDTRRYWKALFEMDRTRGDMATLQSYAPSNDFLAKEVRAFVSGYGFPTRPLWITAARVDTGQESSTPEDLARLTFVNYVSAFANGAEKIFSIEEKPSATVVLMHALIGGFQTVERLGDHVVKFDLGDHVVYALWSDAVLPEDVNGRVDVMNVEGNKKRMGARNVKADEPIFVIVE